MQRRTFLQGTAATVFAAQFGPAFAQGQSPVQGSARKEPTIIYNQYYKELQERKISPLDGPPELLRQFGLPQPPPEFSPLYPLWRDLFGGEIEYREAFMTTIETNYQTNFRFQQVQVGMATRYETSPNWSGAYVHPRDGNMIVDVAGGWNIPGISMPGGLSGVLPPACSIWVGLDGQRRYINSSLPQIGTRQELDSNGNEKIYGWYQWWVRGAPPATSLPQVPITLAKGDTVLCLVQASAPSEAIVAMVKFGFVPQFWSGAISPVISPFTGQKPIISGATAEWVVERPTLLGSVQLHRLPRFDPVDFKLCVAADALDINPSTVALQSLTGARFIQMFEALDGPERISMLSKPRHSLPANSHDFRVNYIGG